VPCDPDDDWPDDPPEPTEPMAWQRYDASTEPGGLIRARCETNDNLDVGYPSEYASWELTWPDLDSFLRAVSGGSHQGVLCQVTVMLDGCEICNGQPLKGGDCQTDRSSGPSGGANPGTAKDGRAPAHQPQAAQERR
jgi:hypothetical protein